MLANLRAEDLKVFCRMSSEDRVFISFVGHPTAKQTGNFRQSISVEERRAQHTLEKASPLTIGTIRVKNESL
jgi:hypothetical protein